MVISAPELRKWIDSLGADTGVTVDDGGTTLIAVDFHGKKTGAYVEIGGEPVEPQLIARICSILLSAHPDARRAVFDLSDELEELPRIDRVEDAGGYPLHTYDEDDDDLPHWEVRSLLDELKTTLPAATRWGLAPTSNYAGHYELDLYTEARI
jgi:hypothetical protein